MSFGKIFFWHSGAGTTESVLKQGVKQHTQQCNCRYQTDAKQGKKRLQFESNPHVFALFLEVFRRSHVGIKMVVGQCGVGYLFYFFVSDAHSLPPSICICMVSSLSFLVSKSS